MANNGILHVISGVMFPPSGKILETIRKRPDMTILTKGLIDIDLTDILEGVFVNVVILNFYDNASLLLKPILLVNLSDNIVLFVC